MAPDTPELRRHGPLASSLKNDQKHKKAMVYRSSEESQPSSSSLASALSDQNEDFRRVKVVLIGDAAVGKTSLIVSYTTDGYPQEYVPTAFDNYSVLVRVDGQPVKVQLCDTAGQDDFDNLRPLCYPNTDVFLLCFSVVNPISFQNIRLRWIPELSEYAPNVPIILLATESDLRTNLKILLDLNRHNRSAIFEQEALELANDIGAVRYIECSSLTQQNLKEAFDAAILTALKLPNGESRSRVQMDQFRGRKSFRKWKNKLMTRSNSADSMKHLRVKNSPKGKITNAQSIGRLNFHYCSSESPVNRSELRRLPRQSYAEALNLSCAMNQSFSNGKDQKKLKKSTSNHCTSPAKGTNVESEDISKVKKGWKKLLCVV